MPKTKGVPHLIRDARVLTPSRDTLGTVICVVSVQCGSVFVVVVCCNRECLEPHTFGVPHFYRKPNGYSPLWEVAKMREISKRKSKCAKYFDGSGPYYPPMSRIIQTCRSSDTLRGRHHTGHARITRRDRSLLPLPQKIRVKLWSASRARLCATMDATHEDRPCRMSIEPLFPEVARAWPIARTRSYMQNAQCASPRWW